MDGITIEKLIENINYNKIYIKQINVVTMSNKNRKITVVVAPWARDITTVALSPATTLWIFLTLSFVIMTA